MIVHTIQNQHNFIERARVIDLSKSSFKISCFLYFLLKYIKSTILVLSILIIVVTSFPFLEVSPRGRVAFPVSTTSLSTILSDFDAFEIWACVFIGSFLITTDTAIFDP